MDKKIVFYALIGIDIVIVALLCFFIFGRNTDEKKEGIKQESVAETADINTDSQEEKTVTAETEKIPEKEEKKASKKKGEKKEDKKDDESDDKEKGDNKPEEDYRWVDEYLEIVNTWKNKHGADDYVGYSMAYLNDDDIPELVLTCPDGPFAGVDIYTVVNGIASRVELEPFENENTYSDYTIPGRQGQGDSYIERSGVYIMEGAGGGQWYEEGFILNGNSLDQIYNHYTSWISDDHTDVDPEAYYEEYNYDFQFKKRDGSFFNDSQTRTSEDPDTYAGYFEFTDLDEKYFPEIEKEYGFKREDMKSLGGDYDFDYDSIVDKIKSFRP